MGKLAGILIGAVTALAVGFSLTVQAAGYDKSGYDKLMNLETKDLYAKAKALEASKPDSALLFYSIIGGRYGVGMKDDDKKICIEALLNKGRIYFYNYYNLPYTYESLSDAKEIAEKEGIICPALNMQLGILYQTIGEPAADRKAEKLAFINYRRGLAGAIDIKDERIADASMSNLLYLSYMNDKIGTIQEDWASYMRFRSPSPNTRFIYNQAMYRALTLLKQGNQSASIEVFDSLINHLKYDDNMIRYRLGAYLGQGYAMMQQGDYRRAINTLQIPLKIARDENLKDVIMDVYGHLATCYGKMNDSIGQLAYENRWIKLKDSLINYSQLSRLEEMRKGRDLRKYEEQMVIIETKRQTQQTILLVSIGFSAGVLILLIILYNRNKRLNQTNLALYSKNVDILEQNEKEKRLRVDYEREIEALRKDPQGELGAPKYRNSTLDEKDKTEIAEAIVNLMETGEEYLNPDFTLDRLAELSGFKPKLISQVINEKLGRNLNSFINEYRIREACRRIRDIETYGNLTLDAISKSVGFRARSSFFNAFKSFTGLTPSEFQKISANERKKP
jgi:AraC-like DNA-binding protein